MTEFQAIVVRVEPGKYACDSVCLKNDSGVFQLALLKGSEIEQYIGKEVIIDIDGEDVLITEVKQATDKK